MLIQAFFSDNASIAGGGVETAPKARQNRVEMKSIRKSQNFGQKKKPGICKIPGFYSKAAKLEDMVIALKFDQFQSQLKQKASLIRLVINSLVRLQDAQTPDIT